MANVSGTSDDLLTMLQEQFVEAADSTTDARDESELHRQYYDGVQWTDTELAALRARNQPPITDNRIKDKIEYLLGLERRTRTDPKAFPRTRAMRSRPRPRPTRYGSSPTTTSSSRSAARSPRIC